MSIAGELESTSTHSTHPCRLHNHYISRFYMLKVAGECEEVSQDYFTQE